MILIGKSGLFKKRNRDETLTDISGFFESSDVISIPENIEILRNELDKWFQMPLNEIIETKIYSNFPIWGQMAILYHMKYDYRFKGDLALFDDEIEKLRQREELRTKENILNECSELAIDSRQDALQHLEDWITTTQRELLISKVKPYLSIDLDTNLLNSRMDYLLEIKSYLNSSFFDDPPDEDIKDDHDDIFEQNHNFQEFLVSINLEEQEKFVYCHKFGIINHLMEQIKESNPKQHDNRMYPQLALATGLNIGTIKRLMTFSKNPDSSTPGNPFKNDKLMQKVNKTLTILGLR